MSVDSVTEGERYRIVDSILGEWNGTEIISVQSPKYPYAVEGSWFMMADGKDRPDGRAGGSFIWPLSSLQHVTAPPAEEAEQPTVEPTVESLKAQLFELECQFEAFKQRVVTVAQELAEENDMCEVVDDALEEMGLIQRHTVRVVLYIPSSVRDGISESMSASSVAEWLHSATLDTIEGFIAEIGKVEN